MTTPTPIVYDPLLPQFPDVSHYRVILDEPAFLQANTPLILAFKVNEDSVRDKTAQRNIDICERNGLLQVGYEFDHDGKAEQYLQRFPPKDNRIACLDAEATNLTLVEAENWVSQVERVYGAPPLVYGRSWFVGKPISQSILTTCPFWICQYGNKLFVPSGIKDVRAWQFTDGEKGPFQSPRRFDGIGPCDISSLLKPLR